MMDKMFIFIALVAVLIGIYVIIGSINGLSKIKELERKMKNGR